MIRRSCGTPSWRLRADAEAHDAADTTARIASSENALIAAPGDPVAGNPKGDVTLVEFYDPRCPYCRRMLPAIQSLIQHDHKLRVVYKDIPVLGPASVLEARAILAAQRQGGYEKMQSALMSNPGATDRQPDPGDCEVTWPGSRQACGRHERRCGYPPDRCEPGAGARAEGGRHAGMDRG